MNVPSIGACLVRKGNNCIEFGWIMVQAHRIIAEMSYMRQGSTEATGEQLFEFIAGYPITELPLAPMRCDSLLRMRRWHGTLPGSTSLRVRLVSC